MTPSLFPVRIPHARPYALLLSFVLAVASVPTASSRAFAQEPAVTGDPTEQAKALLKQGSTLFLQGKYAEALEALDKSYELVPSPNSALIIARCLQALGRLVDSQAMFASAEVEAKRRVAEGAPKYAPTAQAAATEGAAVRAQLGTLRIRIEGPSRDTTLAIDNQAAAIPAEGDLVAWHAPGEVTVTLRAASGLEEKQLVTVRAGAEVTVGFTHPEPPGPATSAPTPETANQPAPAAAAPPTPPLAEPRADIRDGAAWARPAAIASGVVTVVGAGMFTAFGLAEHSTWQDLFNRCGSKHACGPAEESRAQTAKSEQLVANVSLVVGSAAGLATIAFAVIALTNPPVVAGARRPRAHLLVGATTAGFEAEFP
jgi:hypothetical protein